ncbi:succinate dehydrogenase, cytochrome b556 subunit [Nioella nitratireducens]|uniref:succinate dehydrogenase, cytochrome b556 subunit n=1 Tax=Nioella nitratireducens TaxID=1287720 RepID=UPI0008FD22B0|nr:succinate dehydrogenase, cytochrome b556 subunit [Nioella nitratireducens]
MADVNRGNRPLSPHLQIYRKQLNSVTSIINRLTGISLLGGALLVVWWLMAAASSAEYFAFVDGLMTSVLGDIVMTLSLLALWYHALAGVRHLVWDMGFGLDPEASDKMGWGIIIGTVAFTFLTIIAI